MRGWIVAGWLAVSWPALAVAQETPTPEQRIEAALDRAASVGIPEAVLEGEIARGHAAGLPLDRLADAVERRLDGLARARDALASAGHDVSTAEIVTGANAVGAGVSAAALEAVARMRIEPDKRRIVALAVLTELVTVQDIPADRALMQLEGAIAAGPGALESLPEQTRAGQRPALPAAAAAGRAGFAGPPAWLGLPGAGAGRLAGAGRP